MNRFTSSMLTCMLITVLTTILLTGEVASAASSSSGTWKVVSSPNVGSSFFNGVAAVSTNDVWAVGDGNINGNNYEALAEHWNGSQWSIVKTPNPGSSQYYLNAITAVSTNDVWAVGSYVNSSNLWQILAEHWNGSQWSIVMIPDQAGYNNQLYSMEAISTNNVWTVGYYGTNTNYKTLIEHWDGIKWSIVASPSHGQLYNILEEVRAVSATDIWSVGVDNSGSYRSLIEHWDGSQWSVISSPNHGSSNSDLNSIAAVSTNDVWAVGDYLNSSKNRFQTLIEHWNGKKWSIVKSPNPPSPENNVFLGAVAAVSATDIWAVGGPFPTPTGNMLIEHWNGTQWSIVKSPKAGSAYSSLAFMTVVSAKDVWATGQYVNKNSNVSYTLAVHYS